MKYETFNIAERDVAGQLNKLSAEGWEFVCLLEKDYGNGGWFGVFKRYAPIPEEVAQAANNDKAFLTKG